MPSSLPPLSHHEILALAEPFVRRGRSVDLAASDRAARQLAFKPRPADLADGVRGTEVLRLGPGRGGGWELRRSVQDGGGLEATLTTEGHDPALLLDWVDAVPPAAQWRTMNGTRVALCYRLRAPTSRAAGAPPMQLLHEAHAQVAGLSLRFRLSGVGGYPAEFELLRTGEPAPDLPEDLFAVLGRDWGRLVTLRRGWEGSVRLRGEEPRRSACAEARLTDLMEHLARTLAEPPATFHQRFRLARWRLTLADTLPWAAGAAIVGFAFWVQQNAPGQRSLLAVLANMAPPLLMGLFFLRREMPRMGLPRLPRKLTADAWRPGSRA